MKFKRLKSAIIILIVGVVFFAFAGCKSNSGNKVKIGVTFPNLNTPYYVEAKQHLEGHITSLGGEILVADAQDNENQQINQAKTLIDQGVKVIVINAVNVNTAGAIVRYAHQNGVKVIAYDRMIKNCEVDYYVSFDSEKIGEMMASYAIQNASKGNYILFYGDPNDKNAHDLKKGQLSVLEESIESGDVNVMYQSYIDNWSGDNAAFLLSQILEFTDKSPDVLISPYDGISTSCINVLQEKGINNLVVTGQNGELEAFRNILSNKQSMTIYKSTKNLALKTAEIAWSFAKNKKISNNTVYVTNGRFKVAAELLEARLITSQNIQQEIIEKGIYNEDEISEKVAMN